MKTAMRLASKRAVIGETLVNKVLYNPQVNWELPEWLGV
jgi:hypothetical protein